jgi:arsenite methyltransferase
MQSRLNKPDYGIDAPGVVRNLLFVGAIGMAVVLALALHFWMPRSMLAPLFYAMIGAGTGCLSMALWMIWYSRIGKIRGRDKILDGLALRGDENVLDVGCGRGLYLLGAARRLKTGRAVGIDIWNTRDLSGNAAFRTRTNAEAEGVLDRIELMTADARQLPFADGSFDLVLSSFALHNIYDVTQRRRAISEIARVLKSGGRVVLLDLGHLSEYASVLRDAGVDAQVKRPWTSNVLMIWTFGALRPGQVRAQRR